MKRFSTVFLLTALSILPLYSATTVHDFTTIQPRENVEKLKKDPATLAFLSQFDSYRLLTRDNKMDNGYFSGEYRAEGIPLVVEAPMSVSTGALTIHLDMPALQDAIKNWREKYEVLAEFERYSPKLVSATFRDGNQIEARYELKGKTINFLLIMPTKVDGINVEDKRQALKEFKKFLTKLEKDRRAGVILANNKSGRRVFIMSEIVDGETRYSANHPMHSITWNINQKYFVYAYTDDVRDVSTLKEVRKVLSVKEIKAFAKKMNGKLRVQFSGSDKEGYWFSVRSPEAQDVFTGRLIKRKVTLE